MITLDHRKHIFFSNYATGLLYWNAPFCTN